jgi:hypothetical protein
VQGQANKWVKSMEGRRGLKVLSLQTGDLARQVENAIQFGNPVLLQVRYTCLLYVAHAVARGDFVLCVACATVVEKT